jgi:hypothetical protein
MVVTLGAIDAMLTCADATACGTTVFEVGTIAGDRPAIETGTATTTRAADIRAPRRNLTLMKNVSPQLPKSVHARLSGTNRPCGKKPER